MECRERGDVLQEIWDSQVGLSEKIFISLSKANESVEKEFLVEINRLHKHYQFELDKYFKTVDSKSTLLEEVKSSLSKSIMDNRYAGSGGVERCLTDPSPSG